MRKYFFIILFLIAIFLRFYRLGSLPSGLSPVEANFGIFLSNLFNTKVTDLTVIRSPFALLGTLSVYLFYKWMLVISKKKVYSLLCALLLAMTPWHVQESRIFSWGILVFVVILLVAFLLKEKLTKNFGKVSSVLLAAGLLCLVVSIFDFPETAKNEVDYQRNIASKKVPAVVTRIFSNKLIESYRYREGLFFEQLDFGNYFFSGYPRPRWGVEEYPKLFIVLLPFLLIGLFKLKKETRLLLLKLFLAYTFLLTALGLRAPTWGLPLLIILIPIISVGLIGFYEFNRYRYLVYLSFLVLVFECAHFATLYSKGISESQFTERTRIYSELTKEILSFSKEYDLILVTPRLTDPKTYFDFYVPELSEKIDFRDFDLKKDSSPGTLFVGVLPFEPSPSEPLYKKDGNWPEFIRVLAEFEDTKRRQTVVLFSSHL